MSPQCTLKDLGDESIAGCLRQASFWPPNEDYRIGLAAFTVRSDVGLDDLGASITTTLAAVRGLLMQMECDVNLDEHQRYAISGTLNLLQQASAYAELLRECIALPAVAAPCSTGAMA